MIARTVFPPNDFSAYSSCVFLAGSIEMGKAEDWQSMLIEACAELPVTFLNPRRPEWDSSWEQSIDNPVFAEQVNWELDGLGHAEMVVYYFAPETKAPITLMELGLHARSGKVVVCCPEGYWRKGNVDIVCRREGIPQVDDLEGLITALRERF